MYRVLIVEDETPLRRIIMRNLAVRDYTVVETDSVASAIEALEAFTPPFDLVLLDINLPDQAGWDVLRYLEARRTERRRGASNVTMPRVIVMTAIHPAQRRIEEFHPAAVLVKPFPIEALLRLITRVLAGAAPQREENDETVPPEPHSLPAPDSAAG